MEDSNFGNADIQKNEAQTVIYQVGGCFESEALYIQDMSSSLQDGKHERLCARVPVRTSHSEINTRSLETNRQLPEVQQETKLELSNHITPSDF